MTLDPTERHGFEYQTWLGFSLFGAGLMVAPALCGSAMGGGTYAFQDQFRADAFASFANRRLDRPGRQHRLPSGR